jgi:hypothetical protein
MAAFALPFCPIEMGDVTKPETQTPDMAARKVAFASMANI